MKTLKLLFFFLILLTFNQVKAWGQGVQTPDCVVFVNISLAAQTTVRAPTTTTSGGAGDNRTIGCQNYTFTYQATGTGALTSVDFQAGKSASTTVTFATWAGTVATGINPNTSSTGATSTFSTGCANAVACTVANSWVQILVTRGTFVGTINGVLYGYRTGYAGGGGGSSTGCPNPCPVDGPTAAGSAPTTPPVLVAGQDGAPGSIRTLKTDGNGSPIPSNASSADADGISNTGLTATGAAAGVLYPRAFIHVFNGTTWDRLVGNTTGIAPVNASSAAADALSNTELTSTAIGGGVLYPRVFNFVFNGTSWDRMPGNTSGVPVANASIAGADAISNTIPTPSTQAGAQVYNRQFPYIFNGSTNDRQFNCPLSAAVTVSAGTDVIIIPLSGTTITRICHLSFSSGTTAADVTVRQGTGSTCGTNQVALSGAYANINVLALDFNAEGALRTTVGGRDVCLHFSTSVTAGGVVTYAQF